MSGKASLDMSASTRSLTTSAERPLAVAVPSRVIRCWLVTEDGQVYLQTPPTKQRVSYECRLVGGLLDAVVSTHPDILAGVRSRDLRFHPCEMSFKPSTKPAKHPAPMISLEWWPMPEFMAVVPPRQIWFALFSEDGSSYFGAPVKSVQVDFDVARVRGLRYEAHSANQSVLNGVQESDLKIYRDQPTLCEREMPLDDTDFAVAHGLTASNPLAVMVPSRKIWFKLYEECGKPYLFSKMDSLWLTSGVLTVQDFLTKGYQANESRFQGIRPSGLTAYKHRTDQDREHSMAELGASEFEPLVVVVPTREFWYAVLDGKGNLYRGMQPKALPFGTRVSNAGRALRAILSRESRVLEGVLSYRLEVYTNEAALRNGKMAVGRDDCTEGLGLSQAEAIVVLVLADLRTACRPFKKQKTIWTDGVELPNLSFEVEEREMWPSYIHIEADALIGFGVHQAKERDLRMFCRGEVRALFELFHWRVGESPGKCLWLYGPPGSGKTSATVAYVLGCMDRTNWIITWIRLAFGLFSSRHSSGKQQEEGIASHC